MPTLNDPVTFVLAKATIFGALMSRPGVSTADAPQMEHIAHGAALNIITNVPQEMFEDSTLQPEATAAKAATAKVSDKPIAPVGETPTLERQTQPKATQQKAEQAAAKTEQAAK